VPSAVAFVALGDVVTAAVYETGRFGRADVAYVWALLAASALGLLASTQGRLYASTWYALRDARRPLRFALVRLAIGAALGIVLAFRGPAWLGIDARWGAAGISLASALAGGVELVLLRRSLVPRIGRVVQPAGELARLWVAAAGAAAVAWVLKLALPPLPPWIAGALVLGTYGASYLGAAAWLGAPDARRLGREILARVTRPGRDA
jgi:putative peptidoglycan lipid II flippase